ncbi:hypothetical protein MPH_06733 [Macrophomina phaseolina MS6]|uniref:DUF7730 domain-containing protein n=1 Tax=Macrophomina phaseolina (strain MS6) TaxID=1126212 RepID=K2S0P3_MACPH|nr:hypothetical protein MPH_06733 [Macrophomina phaseolina MS6]
MRQRESVSYAEIGSDDELINDSDEDGDYELTPRKKPKKAKPLPKQKIFPFLSLPRELRDMIYGYCLTDPIGAVYIEERTIRYRRAAVRVPKGPQVFINNYSCGAVDYLLPQWPQIETYPMGRPQPEPHAATLTPALLTVCKQILNEALPLLYTQPMFFEDTCALHGFLSGLRRETRGLLLDITVLSDYSYRSLKSNFDIASLTLLAEGGSNLKALRFHDPCYSYRHRDDIPKRAARKFYRRAFRLLDVLQRERGVDEAVRVMRIFGNQYDSSRDYQPDEADEFGKELRRLMLKHLRT